MSNELIRTVDHSGQPFGLPSPKFGTRSWRIKNNVLVPKAVGLFKAEATAATLLGQDSVGVTAMSRGLAVYCGYEGGTAGYANGSYTTMPQVYAVFPGKLYVSVGRDAIDIEPGLASPSQGPGFVRAARPPHCSKPVVYCSAGDLSTVVGYLNSAGIPRSSYLLWSAHWIGEHICGPNTCGYLQCDGTQYASNNSFDSDVFSAYMFGTPVPPPPVFPMKQGATGAQVVTLQHNLNKWHGYFPGWPKGGVVEDGSFGPATAAAVALAQGYFKDTAARGTVTQSLFNKLAAPLPKPTGGGTPPPPPPWVFAPVTNLKVPNAGPTSFRVEFDWNGSTAKGTPAKFEVAVCEGTKMSQNIASYPRYIPFIATGAYSQSWGGLTSGTTYTASVRAQASDGTHSAPWVTVTFKTAGTAPVAPKPPVTPPASPNFPLKQGSTDTADVLTLQKRLNAWSFGSLSEDGNFGPATEAAVVQAQNGFKHHEPAPGECDLPLFNALQGTPPPSRYPSAAQAVGANNVELDGEILYGFLRQHGYPPISAAGAIASIWGESLWNPESAGTGGNGLIGWTPPLPGILTGNPAADEARQLPDILSFVANNGDQGAVDSMSGAATVLDAANIWGVRVERFGINDVHPEGVALAQQIALKLDGVNLP